MTAQRVVVDASVALAWFLPDSAQNVLLARRVLEAQENEKITALVPDFWAAEITYRLLKAARAKPSPLLVSLDQAVAAIDQLPRELHATPRKASDIAALAQRYHLQSWDALYFDIAVRNRAMLATLDGGLKTACLRFGIPIWEALPA